MATRKKPAKRRTARPRADTGHVRTFLSGGDLGADGHPTGAESVTHETALTLPHYYACLRVISQTVALLPMGVREALDRGSKKLPDHRLTWLLNNPHPWMAKFAFWQLLVHWAAGWGLGMARIARDPRGEPVRLDPMHPGCVRPFEETGGELWWEWRYWKNGKWETDYVPDVQVFRIHGMGGDGITGYSLIRYASEALGQGLAHQSYGSAFFRNGVWGSGIIEYPHALKVEARDDLKKSIDERFAGARKSFKPLLFEGGMKWNTLTIPNDEAQLIEFGNFNAYAVCRVVGVQPHKIGLLEGAKYKNIEEENVAWVQDGVLPWTTRIEEEGQRKLFFRPGKLYVHLNVNGLLRADHATRFDSYQKAVNSGWITPNMICELEDMPVNPSEAGDAYYMQGANKNLDDIFDPPEPPAPVAAPAVPPAEEAPEEEQPEPEEPKPEEKASVLEPIIGKTLQAIVETQRPAFVAAVRRCLKREANALERVREKHSGDALRTWAEDWQAKQRPEIEAEFAAPLACLGALLGMEARLTAFLGSWPARAVERATNGGVDEETLIPSLATEAFDEARGVAR